MFVHEPTAEYQNTPKPSGIEALTPARALVVELVRRYGVLGFECSHLEVQKLAWFLGCGVRRAGLPDPLALQFTAHQYGPYSDQLRHVLNALDGSYLHCDHRIAEASPFEPIWFEPAQRAKVAIYLQSPAACDYLPALEWTAALIDGFESPLGMELLATVDWLRHEAGVAPTVAAVRAGVARWPGGRSAAQGKQRIFDDHMLGLALEHLRKADAVGPAAGASGFDRENRSPAPEICSALHESLQDS